jgi:hypothetical protein
MRWSGWRAVTGAGGLRTQEAKCASHTSDRLSPNGGGRRDAPLLVALAVLVLAATALTAAPALALPEGRVYELVSPVYKGGYGVGSQGAIAAVAPDGESVAYYSAGAFGGLPSGAEEFDYLARRGSSGWSTEPFGMPATVLSYVGGRDVSSTLDSTLALGKPGPNVEGAYKEGLEEEVFLHSPGSGDAGNTWTSAGVVMKRLDEKPFDGVAYEGGSADLCHLFFDLSQGPLLPQASEAGDPHGVLYELDRGCAGGQPSLRVVGLNNSGKLIAPACPVALGSEQYLEEKFRLSEFNAVAAGGGEVFFESGVGTACVPHQLFVRLGGSRTLEVSRPLDVGGCVGEVGGVPGEVPCAGAASRASATFVGASEDGSRVFFMTKAPLVGGDGTDNLYMASIGCPPGEPGCEVAGREVTSLTDVSADPNGGSAEVQGPVRVATDGSRVYFVARGELLSPAQLKTLAGEKRAVPHLGADNLYVYDAAGVSVAFVADLCSTSEGSGTVRDLSCPSGLERHGSDTGLWAGSPEAQANSCRPGRSSCEPGRFLVFSTFARLTASDTNEARDVYRYDAVTGIIERVSVGEAGYHANGNCEGGDGQGQCDATIREGHWDEQSVSKQYEMDNRALTEDGSRVVFTTAEPLSPAAVNGLANVYEWHAGPGDSEGSVSLVSSGSGEPTEDAVISPEGRDIFFVTSQGLVAQDTDGEADIYDARLGGGFPSLPVAAAPCEGDACQGPLTNPAPLLVPGSVSQAPGQNFAAPTSKPVVKATTKALTNAQMRAKALKACKRGPKKRRATCEKQANRRYKKTPGLR